MVINLENMQIDYFTKQKPKIEYFTKQPMELGNRCAAFDALQLTAELFESKFELIFIWYHHRAISLYLIAYMNTNERSKSKETHTDAVPLFESHRSKCAPLFWCSTSAQFDYNEQKSRGKNEGTQKEQNKKNTHTAKFTFPFWKLRKTELFYLQLFFARARAFFPDGCRRKEE